MHIASNTSGTVEYYHVDHLGSTRLKTAANGSAIYESNYEPFGPSSGETGDEDYRYTGKQEDTTGLYYYGARYYDPDTGRFTTRDTFPGYRRNPQSLNKYSYCQNNPLKYNDPTGNIVDPITAALAVTAVIVIWDIIEAHRAGINRKEAYIEKIPDAPDYTLKNEYLIGFDKKMVGNVVEKNEFIPLLKYTDEAAMEAFEIELVNPVQKALGVPGYEDAPTSYEGPKVVENLYTGFVHETFKIPSIDNKMTIVSTAGDILVSELWCKGIQPYTDPIFGSVFNLPSQPFTPYSQNIPLP